MSYSLFLYPENSCGKRLPASELFDYLLDHEFCAVSDRYSFLLPGRLLMDYISFLGCSPSLRLGEIESSIKIHQFDTMTGMGGESVETIRYPQCKHSVQNPVQLVNNNGEGLWQCPVCGLQGESSAINWRKTAGFSTLFIEISQIFPKEAIPSDKLLTLLKNWSQSNWYWFYSRTQL